MKNYRFKIKKPDWAWFYLCNICYFITLLIIYIFILKVKIGMEFNYWMTGYAIFCYALYGKYPYGIVRKEEDVENEKL